MDIADSSGNRLLDIHIVPESRLSEFQPTPASFVVVTLKDTVLLVFDRWREQWELPGGMREPGETARQAAVRELAEETGMRTSDLEFAAVAEFSLRHPDRHEYAAVYRTALTTMPRLVVNDEVSDFRWWAPTSPVDGATSPLDAEIARRVS